MGSTAALFSAFVRLRKRCQVLGFIAAGAFGWRKMCPSIRLAAPTHLVSGMPLCTALSGHLEPTVQKINDL